MVSKYSIRRKFAEIVPFLEAVKRGANVERAVLNAFLLHPICRKRLSDLAGTHFAAYRDERLAERISRPAPY